MKTGKLIFLSLLFCLPGFLALPLFAQKQIHYANDRMIVKFVKEVIPSVSQSDGQQIILNLPEIDALNKKYSVSGVTDLTPGRKRFADDHLYLFSFSTIQDIPRIIEEYGKTGYFEFVEPDFTGRTGAEPLSDSIMPDDTYFYNQWSLYNDGTFSYSPVKIDADIDMTEGWTVEQGDSNIVIGIIDSGDKMDHPEFSGRIWININEIPGNGIDDDANGYIDDVRGWDWANNDNDPTDDLGHGTNVAGIIGANGNNSLGYAGVDWNCRLMIMKGINSSNWGYYSWWISAISYAVEKGVRVINMSLFGTDVSQALQDAVENAIQNNVSIIACMGNSNNSVPGFPAAYAGVISVGSTDANDVRSHPFFWSPTSGSNYGSWISVVAPGNYIFGLSYNSNTNYGTYWGGTSQATPHVAGLAGLLYAQDPSRTQQDIRSIIDSTAEDQVGDPVEDTPGWDQYYGYGRVNAYDALTYTGTGIRESVKFDIRVFPNPSGDKIMVISLNRDSNPSELILTDLPGNIIYKNSCIRFPFTIDVSNLKNGLYFLTVKSSNGISTCKEMIY